MKKISLLIVATAFSFAVKAQEGTTSHSGATGSAGVTSTSGTNPNTAAHVCTAACKDGKHVYAHGEKGHVCTDACKKAKPKKDAVKK